MSRYLISHRMGGKRTDREDVPNAVLLAMSVNSRRSGFVHFFTSRAESRTNSFRGAMAMSATSMACLFVERELEFELDDENASGSTSKIIFINTSSSLLYWMTKTDNRQTR